MFNLTHDMLRDLQQFLELYYYKILRVNLTKNTYEVILARPGSYIDTSSSNLEEWLSDYCAKRVTESDKEYFLNKVKLENLKGHSNTEYWFTFKRNTGGQDCKTAFILLPSIDYEDDNQVAILFIKEQELPM